MPNETFVCGDCQTVRPAQTSGGTGYATIPNENNKKVCYSCADKRQLADLSTSQEFVAHLSGDGKRLTTWSGGSLARVVEERELKGIGWHGSSQTYVRAVTEDGVVWYGRGAGRGMSIRIHRSKRHVA